MKTNIRKSILLILMTAVLISFSACGSIAEKGHDATDIGTLIKTKIKAEADKKYHSVDYKITGIVRDKKQVNAYIDNYNSSGKATSIPDISGDKLEYCVIVYEVAFPSDFPQSSFGITAVTLPFKITGENGGPIKVDGTEYKGLGDTYEIGDVPMGYDFHAGDTYKGRALFLMVKNYSGYEITESYDEGGGAVTHYIKGE